MFTLGSTTAVGDYRVDTKYLVTDLNGDTRSDLVEVWNNKTKFFAATWISDGLGQFSFGGNTAVGDYRSDTEYLVMDLDGDTSSDLVEVWNNKTKFFAATWISNDQGQFSFGGNTAVGDYRSDTEYLIMDVNGDSSSDLIELWNNKTKFFATTWISDDLGKFSFGSTTAVGDYRSDTEYLVTDLNGDTRSDLVELWNNKTKFFATTWIV